MLSVYKTRYKLNGEPFRLSPDHQFSFAHPSYTNAEAYLKYAISQGEGFVVITGGPGSGKTTLINAFLEGLDKTRIHVAMLKPAQLDPGNLIGMVADSLGLHNKAPNNASILSELEQFLKQQIQRDRRAVLIVDEAQGLSSASLEELRLLSNLQHDARLLLQVFLVGQEQLQDMFHAPGMDHLLQRLIAASEIKPLKISETVSYVEHRLCHVGWQGDPAITEDALRLIHKFSGGVPRRINLICQRLFLYGGIEKKHALDGEDARYVIEELHQERLLTPEVPDELSVKEYAVTKPGNTGLPTLCLPRTESSVCTEKSHQPSNQADSEAPTADNIITQTRPILLPPRHKDNESSARPLNERDRAIKTMEEQKKQAVATISQLESKIKQLTKDRDVALGEQQSLRDKMNTLRGEVDESVKKAHEDLTRKNDNEKELQGQIDRLHKKLEQQTIYHKQAREGAQIDTDSIREQLHAECQERANERTEMAACQRELKEQLAVIATEYETNQSDAIEQACDAARQEEKERLRGILAAHVETEDQIIKLQQDLKKAHEEIAEFAREAKDRRQIDIELADGLARELLPVEPDAGPEKHRRLWLATVLGILSGLVLTVVIKTDIGDQLINGRELAEPPEVAGKEQLTEQNRQLESAEEERQIQSKARNLQIELERDEKLREARQAVALAALGNSNNEIEMDEVTGAARAPQQRAKPTFPEKDQLKSLLLAGRWSSEGNPAVLFPSDVTYCKSGGNLINCWSIPQNSSDISGSSLNKVEATLRGFSTEGSFQIYYRKLMKLVPGDDGTAPTPVESSWQVSEHTMECQLIQSDWIQCHDENDVTSDYHQSEFTKSSYSSPRSSVF